MIKDICETKQKAAADGKLTDAIVLVAADPGEDSVVVAEEARRNIRARGQDLLSQQAMIKKKKEAYESQAKTDCRS